MGKSLVSNPPYNMKWEHPPFAQIQSRFAQCEIPPSNNANYAFILTALDWIDDKAAMLLPNGVLSTDNKQESSIRKWMVENNFIKAVITLPDSMFESTNIPTCIFLLDKNKQTRNIIMIDMRNEFAEEQRDQRGQFGGSSHENRVYHKTIKVLDENNIQKALEAIENQKNISGFSKTVPIEEIRLQNYILTPGRYIESEITEVVHRSYEDVTADYNRIIAEKNALRLTINESLAKSLGLYDMFVLMKNKPDLSDSFAIVAQKAEKENFIQLSKNAAEFKIENKNRDHFPEILSLFLQTWKQHIMYLNNEENRLLAEFRDALLQDLMSGKISIENAEKE